MKNVLLGLILVIIASCTNPVTNHDPGQTSGSEIGRASIKVYDGNNELLGHATSISDISIKVMSPKDYLYTINWEGKVTSMEVQFTGANATGIPFTVSEVPNRYTYYAKCIYSNGTSLYSFKDVSDANTANPALPGRITSYGSNQSCYGEIHNMVDTAIYDFYNYYELVIVSNEITGIPNTIALPLRLESQ